jgi:hypothetical protein
MPARSTHGRGPVDGHEVRRRMNDGCANELKRTLCRIEIAPTTDKHQNGHLSRVPIRLMTHWENQNKRRLSLLTFFGAAKKVSAAPHRGKR